MASKKASRVKSTKKAAAKSSRKTTKTAKPKSKKPATRARNFKAGKDL